jgi:protease-4
MSKHLRAHYRDMLEHINNDVARRVATGRDLGVTQVRSFQAQRMFSPKQAKAAGLVDRIVPWRGAEFALGTILGDGTFKTEPALTGKQKRRNTNPMTALLDLFKPKKEREVDEDSIVVLHLSGQIVDGKKPVAGSIVSGPSVETIQKLIGNDKVKGVVVRVNSPGGSATASEAILLALQDLAAKKPVVVSMGNVAASGGYYVTCMGRPILAEPGTITGSIGVFGMRPVVGALMRRVGMRSELVALDDSAEMNAIDRPWSDEAKKSIQTHVTEIYDVFIGHVSRSRKMSSKVGKLFPPGTNTEEIVNYIKEEVKQRRKFKYQDQ